MKTGRLSKKEWDFIERNADLMTPEKIAEALGREISPVQNYLKKIGKSLNKKEDFEVQAEYDLKSRPYYKDLKQQFTPEELELFAYHWKQIVAQFSMDVLPTEELQIIDCVKLQVLSDRALREQRECVLKIAELEKEAIREKKILHETDDPMEKVEQRDRVYEIEKTIANMRLAKESLSKDFKELQDKKGKVFKDIKGTRDQRIDRIEGNKETFPSLVGKIIRDPNFRENLSLEMEKMRLAMEAEKERLSDYFQFGSETDQCFLNAETVKD